MMRKSVYSLVLMDDVVEAIDRLAYERNTNRSNLITQILAGSVNFTTPELKMRDIFERLESMLEGGSYRIAERSSGNIFAVQSAIRYKYRPTVKYMIELFREPEDIAGRLKVSFRTSSKNFTDAVEDFFIRWLNMENAYLKRIYPNGVPGEIDGAKYVRGFLSLSGKNALSENDMALAIGEYIKVLDSCIKFYFENLENEEAAEEYIRHAYGKYLECGVPVV